MDRKLVGMIFKNGDNDCEVCYPEIPMDEPLLQELFAKYETSGWSVRGTCEDVKEDILEILNA